MLDEPDCEPGYGSYREHLKHLNYLVWASGEALEGNLFYYHNTRVLGGRPDVGRQHKRRNFVRYILGSYSLLEIGFNAGHSALLALTINPDLLYTAIDVGTHRYTEPCFDYLTRVFPDRCTLHIGDSREVLPLFRSPNRGRFDRYHVDGGHSIDVAEADIRGILGISRRHQIIMIDDVNLEPIWELCQRFVYAGIVTGVHPSHWEGREQLLIRSNAAH